MSKNSDYVTAFRNRRRKQAKEHLGNKCVKCGTSEDLEFDHIDPDNKSFTISDNLQKSADIFWVEVDKCQLLCSACHTKKTVEEQRGRAPWNKGKVTHGTQSTAYNLACECMDCSMYKAKRNELRRNKRKVG